MAEQYQAYFQINTSWIDQPNSDGNGPSFIGGMNLKWSSDVFEAATQAGNAADRRSEGADLRQISPRTGP